MKKVIIRGRQFLELPEELTRGHLLVVRIDEGLYLVGREEKIGELLKRQIRYMARRREEPEEVGFWVFDTETEAADFSRRHAAEFQSGSILGIRGFDGKYYAVRRQLYDALLPRILGLLRKGPRTVEELASILKKDRKLIKAVLELAREEGLVIERSGGVYEYTG